MEMEDYRERLKMGQIISDAVPIQQRLPPVDEEMVEAEAEAKTEIGGESPRTPENESTSGKTDSEDDKTGEKEFDMETYPEVVGVVVGECSNVVVGMETSVEEEAEAEVAVAMAYESGKRVEKVGVESEECMEKGNN